MELGDVSNNTTIIPLNRCIFWNISPHLLITKWSHSRPLVDLDGAHGSVVLGQISAKGIVSEVETVSRPIELL